MKIKAAAAVVVVTVRRKRKKAQLMTKMRNRLWNENSTNIILVARDIYFD